MAGGLTVFATKCFSKSLLDNGDAKVPARTDLNVAAINGSLLIATLIGWAAGSWTIFFMTSAVLIAAAVYTGKIRPAPRKQ